VLRTVSARGGGRANFWSTSAMGSFSRSALALVLQAYVFVVRRRKISAYLTLVCIGKVPYLRVFLGLEHKC